MNIFHIHVEEITWNEVNNLMGFINSNGNLPDVYYKLYINSNGGDLFARDTFVKVMNNYDHEIHVIGAESASFEILFLLDGLVFIEDYSFGMFHLGTSRIQYKDGIKKTSLSLLQEEYCKNELERTKDIINKLRFTDNERNIVLSGENLYFNAKRLRELFEYKDGYKLIEKHKED